MAYNNRFYDPSASSNNNNSPQFTTNPSRAKSQKWTSAPKIDYGGDDWGEDEEEFYDESGNMNQQPTQPNNWNRGYGGPPVPSIPAQFAPNCPGRGIERSMTMPLGGDQGYSPVMGIARQGTLPLAASMGGGAVGGNTYGPAPIQRKPSKMERERQAQETGQQPPRRSGQFIEDTQAENQPAPVPLPDNSAKPATMPTTPTRIRRPAEIYASAQNSPVDTRPRTADGKSPKRQPTLTNPSSDVPDVPQHGAGDATEASIVSELVEFGGELSKPPSTSPTAASPSFNVPQPSDMNSNAVPRDNNSHRKLGEATDSALLAPPGPEPAGGNTAEGGLSRSDTSQSKESVSFAKMVSHAFSRKPQDSEDTTPQSGVDVQETTENGVDNSVSPILPRVSQELENIAQERAATASPGSEAGIKPQEAAHPGSGPSSKLSSQVTSPSIPTTATFEKPTGEASARTSPPHPSVAILKEEGPRLGWRSVSPTQGERRSGSPIVVIPDEHQAGLLGAGKSVEWGVATPITIHKPNVSPIETQEVKIVPNNGADKSAQDATPIGSSTDGEAGTSPATSSVTPEARTKSPSFAAFLGQKSSAALSAARSTSPAHSFKDFLGARSVSPNHPKASTPPNTSQISESSATTPTAGATPRFKDFLLQKSSTAAANKGVPLGVQTSQVVPQPSAVQSAGATDGAVDGGHQRNKSREEPPRLNTSSTSGSTNNESERLTKQIFNQLHYDSPQTESPQSPVKTDAARPGGLAAPTHNEHEPIKPLSTPPKHMSQFTKPSVPPQFEEPSSPTTAVAAQAKRASISPVTPPGGSDQVRQLHLHQPVPNPIARSIPPGSRFTATKQGTEDDYEPSIADYQASTTSDYVPSPVETIQPPFSDRSRVYDEVPVILELRDILALSDAQDRIRAADKARELFASDHEGNRYRLQLWIQYMQSLDNTHPNVWGSGGQIRKMHKPRINPLLAPDTAGEQVDQGEAPEGDKYGTWGSLDDNPRGSRPSTAYAEAQRRASVSKQAGAINPLGNTQAGAAGGIGGALQQQQQQPLPGVPQPAGQNQQQQPQQYYQQQPTENQRLAEFGQSQQGQQPSAAAQFSRLQQDTQGKSSQQSEGHTSFKDKVDKVGGKVGKALPGLKGNVKALFSKKKDKDSADHGGTWPPGTADHIPDTPQSQAPPAGNDLQQLQSPPPQHGSGSTLSPGGFGNTRVGQGVRSVSENPQLRKVVDQTVAGQNRSFSFQGQAPPPQGQPTSSPQTPSGPSHQPTWHRPPQGPQGPVTQAGSQSTGAAGSSAQPVQGPPAPAKDQQQQPIVPRDPDGPPPLRRVSNSRPLPAKRAPGAPPSVSSQMPPPPVSAKLPQQSQPGQQHLPSSFNDPRANQAPAPAAAPGQAFPNYNHQQPEPHETAPAPHPPSTGYEPSFSNASIGSEKPKKRHSFFGSIGGQNSQGDLQPGAGDGEGPPPKSGKRVSSSFFGQLKNQLPGNKHHHTASDAAGAGGPGQASQSDKRKKSGGFAFLKDLGTLDALGKTDATRKKEEPRLQTTQEQVNQSQPSPGAPKTGSSVSQATASDPYVAKIYDSYTGTYMTYDDIVARDKAMEAGMSPPPRPTTSQATTPANVFAAAQAAGTAPNYTINPQNGGYASSGHHPQLQRSGQSFNIPQPGQNALQPPQKQNVPQPSPVQNTSYTSTSPSVPSAQPQQGQQQWNTQTPIPQPTQAPQQQLQQPQWSNQPRNTAPSIASIGSSMHNKAPGPFILNAYDDSTPPPLRKFSPSPSPPPKRSGPPRVPKTNQGLIRKISSPPPPAARFRAIPGSPPPVRQKNIPASPHSGTAQGGGFAVMAPPPSVSPSQQIRAGSPAVQRSPRVASPGIPLGTVSSSGFTGPVPQPTHSVTSAPPPTVSETAAIEPPKPRDLAPGTSDRSATPATVKSDQAAASSPVVKPASPAPVATIISEESNSTKGKEKEESANDKDSKEKERENEKDKEDKDGSSLSGQTVTEKNVPVTNSTGAEGAEPKVVEKAPQNFDYDEKIAVDPEGPVPEPEKADSDDEKVVMSATSGPDFGWEFY